MVFQIFEIFRIFYGNLRKISGVLRLKRIHWFRFKTNPLGAAYHNTKKGVVRHRDANSCLRVTHSQTEKRHLRNNSGSEHDWDTYS